MKNNFVALHCTCQALKMAKSEICLVSYEITETFYVKHSKILSVISQNWGHPIVINNVLSVAIAMTTVATWKTRINSRFAASYIA